MQILGIVKNYTVLYCVQEQPDIDMFMCFEANSKNSVQYLVTRIKKQQISYPVVPLFLKLLESKEVKEFIECFSDQGALTLVFEHKAGTLLFDLLEHEEALKAYERFDVAKKILEYFFMVPVPIPIMYDLLEEKNILVDHDMNIDFEYRLESFDQYCNYDELDLFVRLSTVFRKLFNHELKIHASKELEHFIQRLEQRNYTNFVEVYQEYLRIYELLINKVRANELKPKGFLFTMWEKAKKGATYLKPVAVALLLLATCLFLVYQLFFTKEEKKDIYAFKTIGDVKIDAEDIP